MAKKQVASLQKGGGKQHSKVVKMVKSPKTGAYSFKEEIVMKDGDSVDELMTQIGNAYGNTNALKVVNVSMNSNGQFVIEDKIQG